MEDTGFLLTPAQQARRARMHRRAADGWLQPIDRPAGQGQGFTGGGGGLCGTAGDYGRFLSMLLNGGVLDGVRLLRRETVAEMGRNQIGQLPVHGLVSAAPERSNDADFFPGMVQKWGLGFLLNSEPGPNGRSAWSMGWGGLANCYFWLDPARGVAGCLLVQTLPFADAATLELFGAVERAVYAGDGGD
jgi:CubicO group peptidase (beta-lactamase class C family)